MAIKHIHVYLVHPGKQSESEPEISGNEVPTEGKFFELLNDIYSGSNNELDIDISFNQSAKGTQQNPCRDLIIDYLYKPTFDRGRRIAERLEKVTTHRSGLGLLVLMTGQEDQDRKIVISRFPAHSAILAEEDRKTLSVQFLERVFMKSATAYKAAAYQDSSLASGFWEGQAVDKQINNRVVKISNYWITDFLDSDFRTTSAAGTRRLAISLRDAARKSDDVTVKSEITAAVTLSRSLAKQTLNVREFGERLGLSDAAMRAIVNEVKTPNLVKERFRFDWEEFSKYVAYRSVELDSGGVLTAESIRFDEVFHREVLDKTGQRVRFSTEGKVINERLSKTR